MLSRSSSVRPVVNTAPRWVLAIPSAPTGSTASRTSPQVAFMRVANAANHDSNASPGMGSTRTGSVRLTERGSIPVPAPRADPRGGSRRSRPRPARSWRQQFPLSTSDLDLHLEALLLGGRVGADPVEQILIDTFDAGADRALAGTIDQGGQRADAARTSFEQVVRQVDQHPPVLACQYHALLDGQQ